MQNIVRILFFLLIVRPLLGLVLGINLYGKSNLPKGRQFIMVANHNSHLDTAALLNLFPLSQLQRIHPVAAEDYFNANPLLASFSKICFNILPIPRNNITKSNNPIKRMCEILDAGDSLILFPEGSRGQPEALAPFQAGIAHLIQKYPTLPIVPVYMKGMGRSLPKGEFILVPFFCDLAIGAPLFLTGSKEVITSTLEKTVIELQHYLDD